MFGEMGSFISSVLDRRVLNHTLLPVRVFTNSEPVSPGINMIGFFPWPAALSTAQAITRQQASADIIRFLKIKNK
jgi:hypothetical protein